MNEQDAAVADALYGDPDGTLTVENYRPALRESADRFGDAAGFNAEQRANHMAELALAFDDSGVNSTEAAALHAQLTHHLIKPPDDAQVQEWAQETRRVLRERWGVEEGDRRLQVAGQFVAARPYVKNLLDRSGVGSMSAFVMAIAEKADLGNPRALRMTPRALKKK